jgi:hypothetical protein
MDKELIIRHLKFYEIPCYDITFQHKVIQIICDTEFLEDWQKVLKIVFPQHELSVNEIFWPSVNNEGIVTYDCCYAIHVHFQ